MKKTLKIAFLILVAVPLMVIAINQSLYYTGYLDNASIADNKAPVKFYAINLDRQPEKFAKLKAQTDHLGIELIRFPAVDGYKITLVDQDTKEVLLGTDIKQDRTKLKRDHKYDVYCRIGSYENHEKPEFVYEAFKFKRFRRAALSLGEIGLICTSRLLWHKIANDTNNQLAVIFEDDALLFPGFDQNLTSIIKNLPAEWDITYLDGKINYNSVNIRYPKSLSNIFKFQPLVINNELIKIPTATDIWRTHGYMINTNSAQKMLKVQSYRNAVPLDNLFTDSIKDRDIIAYLATKKIMSFDEALGSDIAVMGRP